MQGLFSHPYLHLVEQFEKKTKHFYAQLQKSPQYKLLGWESTHTQTARFEVFLDLLQKHVPRYVKGLQNSPAKPEAGKIKETAAPRYIDMGCGFAALLEYFSANNIICDYTGMDAIDDHIRYCTHAHSSSRFFKGSFLELAGFPAWGEYDVAFISGALNINISSVFHQDANEMLVSFVLSRILHSTAPYLLVNFLHAGSKEKEDFFAYHDPTTLGLFLETFGIRVLDMREGYLPNDFTFLLTNGLHSDVLTETDSSKLTDNKITNTNKISSLNSPEKVTNTDEIDISKSSEQTKEAERIIYTDGGCSGNPGIGAWAFVDATDDYYELGSELHTTNNRMELQAVIAALRYTSKQNMKTSIIIVTDSRYVQQGMETWIHTWKKNKWRRSSGEEVLNKELWLTLDALVQKQRVQWRWVKGHSGDEFNERCHLLLQQEIKAQQQNNKL